MKPIPDREARVRLGEIIECPACHRPLSFKVFGNSVNPEPMLSCFVDGCELHQARRREHFTAARWAE